MEGMDPPKAKDSSQKSVIRSGGGISWERRRRLSREQRLLRAGVPGAQAHRGLPDSASVPTVLLAVYGSRGELGAEATSSVSRKVQ